jgi:hypothetical protein
VTQSGVERCRVVVLKLFGPTTRKHRAIAQTQVRSIIENRNVSLAEQTGNCAECSTKTTVEEHRVFAAKKFCDSRLQFAMKIGHAREHGRTAGAQTVRIERRMGRGDDIRMVGQTEVIVGAKIDDALRLAVVSDGGAGIRTGEQFRLI